MSDEVDSGNGAEKDLSRGLQAISGVGFKDAAPIPPSGWKIEQEVPWHLSAAYMYAMGSRNGEIAEAHGKSPQAVSNLFHQKFFQARVLEIMAENRRSITDLFAAQRIPTLETLIALRDDPATLASVKATVCREILDRSLGRPTQHVAVSSEVTSSDPVAEYERLSAENKRLKDSLERDF